MWWTRRFVSYALPGMFLLVAIGIAHLVCDRRIAVRVIGAVAGLTLVRAFLAQSLPLRDHDELAGSFLVNHAVADAAHGRPATWLWSTGPTPAGINQSAPAFASTMLYREGDPVAILDPKHLPDAVDDYRAAFPDQPLFVVTDGRDLPAELANLDVEKVKEIDVRLPLWELTYARRPTRAAPMPFVFSVYRLRGT